MRATDFERACAAIRSHSICRMVMCVRKWLQTAGHTSYSVCITSHQTLMTRWRPFWSNILLPVTH